MKKILLLEKLKLRPLGSRMFFPSIDKLETILRRFLSKKISREQKNEEIRRLFDQEPS